MKKNRYWAIRGYDSAIQIYERYVPIGIYSDNQIQALLKALTAKYGLTDDEIVGAYARRRSKVSNDHLAIQKEGPLPNYSCGTNPYFTAIVVDENHNRVEFKLPT